MVFKLKDRKTGNELEFSSKEERQKYIEENYEDPNFYQGSLPELVVRTPEAQKAHEARVKALTTDRNNLAAIYRMHDKQAMANPANSYNAALGWINMNASIAGPALSWLASPVFTVGTTVGNVGGYKFGDYISDQVYSNPDQPIKLNTDISVTPRQATAVGTGLVTGLGLGKFLKYGTTERLIGEGAESKVYKKPFGLKVVKHSATPLEDMGYKTADKGFQEHIFKGRGEDGSYIYDQKLVYFPKNKRQVLKALINKMVEKEYYPTLIEGYDDFHFINPVTREAITDLGMMTESGNLTGNQIGWTLNKWFMPQPVIADGGVLSLDDWAAISLRRGGKLRKFSK